MCASGETRLIAEARSRTMEAFVCEKHVRKKSTERVGEPCFKEVDASQTINPTIEAKGDVARSYDHSADADYLKLYLA